MNQNIRKQIKDLADRYADCGISETIILKMMDDHGKPSGLDDRAKLIGVRMCLGMEFNRQELFSLEDLSHVTGETEDEIMELMRKEGINPTYVSAAPWLTGGTQ